MDDGSIGKGYATYACGSDTVARGISSHAEGFRGVLCQRKIVNMMPGWGRLSRGMLKTLRGGK